MLALCDDDLARVSGGIYSNDFVEFMDLIGSGGGSAGDGGGGTSAKPKKPVMYMDPILITPNKIIELPKEPPLPKRDPNFRCC
ncbi:hypothetical protein [Microvirga antarctica]|uniref:hypothetical protein n=1 Tax=Microvirga antarctica TaxID=2819233 RepID=UPI001B310810|nr:hypothetical protein [Microvirga antarctica]